MRVVVALVLALFIAGCTESAPTTGRAGLDRPNILLLVAEDLSSRIGAFGDEIAVTPNLDRLASEGVRYPNTFTTAGVCAPSRAALITGVRQTALGAHHMRTGRLHGFRAVPPAEVKAFPELLRRAGYFTFTTQKLDYQFSAPFPGSGPFTIWDQETFTYADWSAAPRNAPFFGMINYGVTHESGIFPISWPKNAIHAFMLVRAGFGALSTEERTDPASVEVPPYYPDTPTVRRDIARYYDNVREMDTNVGETLATLERDGLADSTIVIWTTDHGDGLPRAKRELFDSGIRVPMIIRWPERFRPAGVEPGTVDERLVSFVDLAATILSLADLTPPAWMDGEVFVGPRAAPPRRYVFASRDRLDEAPDRVRAVRDARYKYIRNFAPGTPGHKNLTFRHIQDISEEIRDLHRAGKLDAVQSRWYEPRPEHELYDLRSDPHEVANLAADPAHAATLARMQGALDAWMAERPDLGEMPEEEMIETYWPGLEQPETAAPKIELTRGEDDGVQVSLSAPTDGSSIGYRVIDGAGNPGAWRVYERPFRVRVGETIEAKAVRYGYAESRVAVAPTV